MAILKDMNKTRLILVLLRKVSWSNVNRNLRLACCCLYHVMEDVTCSYTSES